MSSGDHIFENDESSQQSAATDSSSLVDHFFRTEYAKLVASLTRKFGVRNWELVEDAVQSALHRALISWSLRGIPQNPSAWLYQVASNLALDSLRKDSRKKHLESSDSQFSNLENTELPDEQEMDDSLLRMIYICCNPHVPSESQIALALKSLCGFGNHEIARALLTTEASVAKRISRAKTRLRTIGLEPAELTQHEIIERLPDVQAVVYLLFNEGYSSSVADKLIREELCEEAVRMANILAEHPTTKGPASAAMLALLLFHSARLDARIDDNGAMLLMKEQDRSRWNQRLLKIGFVWFRRACERQTVTRYHAEALIASEHCRAPSVEETNWKQIVLGYELLCKLAPSPIHELNRAIAIGHHAGAAAGLVAFESLAPNSFPDNYYLWHATRAELCRQTGDFETARTSLQHAWQHAPTNAEKELIVRKLDNLT